MGARGVLREDPARALRRALLVLVLMLIAGILVGWGLVEAFPGGLPSNQRLLWATNRVLGGLASGDQFDGRPPRFLFFLLGLFGAIALLSAAATLFRSQRMEAALHGDEEPRIRALLGAYGSQDSLGYFATRRDKAVVFSPNGKGAVTYRVEAGVALASGDPVGDRAAWTPAIEAWLEVAKRYAWAPAVMGASEEGAKVYAQSGLGAIQLGDEAILTVARFDLNGRDMRVIRQAVNRVQRTGATTRVRRHSALTDEEMRRIVDRADTWRDTETERGFSMALDRLGDPADGDCLLVEAFNGDGELIALLSFVPWGKEGISLDLMRRDRTAPNGVMEFMVAELCAHVGKLGVHRISSTSPSSARPSRKVPGSAPARSCDCGGGCFSSSPSGGSWRPCTGPTSSTSPSGTRASSASATRAPSPASAWPPRSPRASSPYRACAHSGAGGKSGPRASSVPSPPTACRPSTRSAWWARTRRPRWGNSGSPSRYGSAIASWSGSGPTAPTLTPSASPRAPTRSPRSVPPTP